MSTLPCICLVDTNVVIAANGKELSKEQECCIEPCSDMLHHITSGGCKLVLDDGFAIVGEYLHKADSKKQRGPGDFFLKWVFTNMSNPGKIDLVTITPEGDSFKEFPDHEGLRQFDPSDRKFVAAANAHAKKPPIVQATDSKWWGWKDALEAVGLSVHFVSEEYIRETYGKKMGQN